MNRLATKITIRHHAYISGKDDNSQATYISDTYEVGKQHLVPSGNETDEVIEIRVSDDWSPHVEVELREWGSIWINNYIIQIEFYEHERYQKVLRQKKEIRKSTGGFLQQTGIG